ncbi:hypothetical protein RZS08_36980, partial [Arthrospira platensis SPKY1]|nr:hypothetical protein [Arthrospira platensis SPKY1]
AAWGDLVLLMDVIVLQPFEGGHGPIEAGRGHAPGADRRTHQIHRVVAGGQPLAKQEAIERPEDQALGPTGRPRHHPDVPRQKALLTNVSDGLGTGMDVQGLHASESGHGIETG